MTVNVPELFFILRGTLHGESPHHFDQMLELLTDCEHLVLDDLGRERQTAWVQETLYLLLNARYEACRATSLTTNLDFDTLRVRLGEAIIDRLAEVNQPFWCRWRSYRRRGEP